MPDSHDKPSFADQFERDFDALTRHRWLAPVLLVGLFVGLCVPNLHVPRVHDEESRENLLFYFGATPPDGPPVQAPPEKETFGITVGDRYFPLMEDTPYVGAVEAWLQLPFFLVLGATPFSLRLMPILVTALGLLAAWAVLRRWFGPRVAFVASLLWATHPIFVHFTRMGHDKEEVFTITFFWLGLYFFDRYFGRGERRGVQAFAGALMWGLGLCHKITFLWYLLGVVVALPVLFPRYLRPSAMPWRHWLWAGGGFVLGLLLLLLYNVQSGGETVRIMVRALTEPLDKDGIDNLDYLANLWVRAGQLFEVIVLGRMWALVWFTFLPPGGAPMLHWLLGGCFVAGLAWGVWVMRSSPPGGASRRRPPEGGWSPNPEEGATQEEGLSPPSGGTRRSRRGGLPLAFLYIVFGVTFLCSPFTVSGHYPSHLLVLYPFPLVVVALLLRGVAQRWPGRLVLHGSNLLLVLLVAGNLALTAWYHDQARKDAVPGSGPFVTYDIEAFRNRRLVERPIETTAPDREAK